MIVILLLPWVLLLMFSIISCFRLSNTDHKVDSRWPCTTLFSVVLGRVFYWRQTDKITCSDDENNAIPTMVPRHIAVIMDGNRRYGVEKYGEALRGHWDGGSTLVNFLQWAQDAGTHMVTAYAFSTENWKRPQREIDELLTIFEKYCRDIKTQVHSAISPRTPSPELLLSPFNNTRFTYHLPRFCLTISSISSHAPFFLTSLSE